eukprot:g349.t1
MLRTPKRQCLEPVTASGLNDWEELALLWFRHVVQLRVECVDVQAAERLLRAWREHGPRQELRTLALRGERVRQKKFLINKNRLCSPLALPSLLLLPCQKSYKSQEKGRERRER